MAQPGDGYYIGIIDANGNLTQYGQQLLAAGLIRRSETGYLPIDPNTPLPPQGQVPPPPGQPPAPPPPPPGPSPGGAPGTAGGFDPNTLFLGANLHVFGVRRVAVNDPQTGKVTYQDETVDLGAANDLNAVSAASGIPVAALQATPAYLSNHVTVDPDGAIWVQSGNGVRFKVTDAQIRQGVVPGVTAGDLLTAQVNAGQNQAQATRLGNFQVVGLNDDGSLQVMKGDGTTTSVTRAQIAAGAIPGVAPSDFDQAVAQAGNARASIARLGQWDVVGMNQDGSLTVHSGSGQYGQITRQQVEAGQFAGITTGMFDQAVAQQQQSQRTLNQGGQWAFHALAGQPGMVVVQNIGTGEMRTLSEEEARSLPGVNPLEIQQARTQQTQTSWEQASAFGPQFPQAPPGYGSTQPSATLAPAATPPPAPQPPPNPTAPPGSPAQGPSALGTPTPQPPPGYATTQAQGPSRSIAPQQQAQYQATGAGAGAAGGGPTTEAPKTPPGYAGTSAGTTPNWSNQQLSLNNQTFGNLQNYIKDTNIGSRNMGGLGFSGLSRPLVAGQ